MRRDNVNCEGFVRVYLGTSDVVTCSDVVVRFTRCYIVEFEFEHDPDMLRQN